MKVVLLGDYACRQAERLRRSLDAAIPIVVLPDDTSREEVGRQLADAAVLVSNRFDAGFPLTPALRLLQSPSAGVDGIDLEEAARRGVAVAVATGHEPAMAEYVLAALLAHTIGLRGMADSMGDGVWTTRH